MCANKTLEDKTISATMLVNGQAQGELMVLDEPLSLWGGMDVHRGVICAATHPQVGQSLQGKLLMMRSGRGSSSSSSTLLEAVRNGTAPSAIILQRPDTILAIGALVAADLYQTAIPMVLVPQETDWQRLSQYHSQALHLNGDSETAVITGMEKP